MKVQMTDKKNILGFIGLIKRAGKLTGGSDSVIAAIRKREAKLLIATTDVSPNTISKILDNISYEIPMYRFDTMEEMGHAISSPPRGIVAVTDEGFAAALDAKLTDYEEDTDNE